VKSTHLEELGTMLIVILKSTQFNLRSY